MNREEKRALIEQYLAAYNAFNLEAMLALIHDDIAFENVSAGQVNAAARGLEEFRRLAEQARTFFGSRRQTMTKFEADGDAAYIEVTFEGVPALDLPNGMKAGQTVHLNGRSEFAFRDGKICRITDIS
ncbi:MAG: nuclear transport factor 2 family protein [Sedimentisphaerales bacterium]|nr:nuclear transport factor 2 family protein [Sedimentisphaerales bacterium]